MTRIIFRVISLGAISFSVATIWLLIVYIEWDFIEISYELAFRYFDAWPWVKMGLTFVIFAIIFPVARFYFFPISKTVDEELAAAWLGFMWIPLMYFYPGAKGLGLVSDGRAMYVIFPTLLIYYLYSAFVTNEIKKVFTRTREFKIKS